MRCVDAQRLMRAYTNGELPDKVTEAFLDHVQVCRDCHEELELYLLVHNTLDEGASSQALKMPGIDEQIFMTRTAIHKRKLRRRVLTLLAAACVFVAFGFMKLEFGSRLGLPGRNEKQPRSEAAAGTETVEEVTESLSETAGAEAVTEAVTEAAPAAEAETP